MSTSTLPTSLNFSICIVRSALLPRSQGDSEKLVLRAFTLKSAARQVDPEAKIGNKRGVRTAVPFFWIVLAIASVLVVISIIFGLLIRTRCFTGRRPGGGGAAGGRRQQHPQQQQRSPFVMSGASASDARGSSGKKKASAATMRFPRHEMEIQRQKNGGTCSRF